MLQYEETLPAFFQANHMDTIYGAILGLKWTNDLAYVSDDDLRKLWLTSDDFLKLWTCKVFVQLHLASWNWQTVIDLLQHYCDELRYDTSDTTSRTVFERILQQIGFDPQKPPMRKDQVRDIKTCDLVLESLREIMQLLNQYKMPVSPPTWQVLDFLVQYKDMLGITEHKAATVLDLLEIKHTAHVNMLIWLEEQEVLGLPCLNEAQKHQLWALIAEYKRDRSYRTFVMPPFNAHTHVDPHIHSRLTRLISRLQSLINT